MEARDAHVHSEALIAHIRTIGCVYDRLVDANQLMNSSHLRSQRQLHLNVPPLTFIRRTAIYAVRAHLSFYFTRRR